MPVGAEELDLLSRGQLGTAAAGRARRLDGGCRPGARLGRLGFLRAGHIELDPAFWALRRLVGPIVRAADFVSIRAKKLDHHGVIHLDLILRPNCGGRFPAPLESYRTDFFSTTKLLGATAADPGAGEITRLGFSRSGALLRLPGRLPGGNRGNSWPVRRPAVCVLTGKTGLSN